MNQQGQLIETLNLLRSGVSQKRMATELKVTERTVTRFIMRLSLAYYAGNQAQIVENFHYHKAQVTERMAHIYTSYDGLDPIRLLFADDIQRTRLPAVMGGRGVVSTKVWAKEHQVYWGIHACSRIDPHDPYVGCICECALTWNMADRGVIEPAFMYPHYGVGMTRYTGPDINKDYIYNG